MASRLYTPRQGDKVSYGYWIKDRDGKGTWCSLGTTRVLSSVGRSRAECQIMVNGNSKLVSIDNVLPISEVGG